MEINYGTYSQAMTAAFKRGYRIGISNDPRGRYNHPDVHHLKKGKVELRHDSFGEYFIADVTMDGIYLRKKIYHKDYYLFMRYGYSPLSLEIATNKDREVFEAVLTHPKRGHLAKRLLSGLIYAATHGYSVTQNGVLLSPMGFIQTPLTVPHIYKAPIEIFTYVHNKRGYFAVCHLMAFQKYKFNIFNTDHWKIVVINSDLSDNSYDNIVLCKA